jgi:hypothetical protein
MNFTIPTDLNSRLTEAQRTALERIHNHSDVDFGDAVASLSTASAVDFDTIIRDHRPLVVERGDAAVAFNRQAGLHGRIENYIGFADSPVDPDASRFMSYIKDTPLETLETIDRGQHVAWTQSRIEGGEPSFIPASSKPQPANLNASSIG